MDKFKDWPGDLGRIKVLEEEVEYYKTLLREHGTGHIHTTINFIEQRIKELQGKKEK